MYSFIYRVFCRHNRLIIRSIVSSSSSSSSDRHSAIYTSFNVSRSGEHINFASCASDFFFTFLLYRLCLETANNRETTHNWLQKLANAIYKYF